MGIKLRPRGSFDNFLLNALIEVSEYANKLLMFSLILWPQLSYLFPQMRDSLIENAVHEPHQVTKLGWPVANFLAYACFLLSLYPLYLAPYFFSFKPPSTCLTFQPVWFLSNTDFIGSVRWGVTRHYSQQQINLFGHNLKAAILRLWQETTSQSRMHFYESNIFFSLKCTSHNGHISMVLLPLLQVGKTEEEKDFFFTNLKQFGAYC